MSNPTPQDKNTIHSVSEYIGRLEKLNAGDKHTLFFRGSADCLWENKPSIFRNSKLIENEDHLYYDTLARCSDNFKHCDNTFENLVMMQHYGIPTRLLDITENPLVALYFACAGNDNADAKVDIFQVENTEIKRYDSDTVAMLANVVKIKTDFDFKEINFVYKVNNLLSCRKYSFENGYDDYELDMEIALRESLQRIQVFFGWQKVKVIDDDYFECRNYVIQAEKYICQINDYFDGNIRSYNIEPDILLREVFDFIQSEINFENDKYQSDIRRLIHFIQADKSYFNGKLIQISDLSKVLCVKPKQDNPHIIRQSGAFFIFGINEEAHDKLTAPSIPDQYLCRQNGKVVSIRIPKAAKPKILEQLKALAISEGTLFTDIEKVAADLKRTYGK